jgi:predicted Zn finger-like uncharacterized protein
MSLITRCPACGTMFKVVADQLRISEGWVRCGHCAEIFDAAADLRDESEIELPTAAAPLLAREQTPASEEVEGVPSSSFTSSLQSEVDESMDEGTPDPFEIEEQQRDLKEDPRDQPFELRRADEPDAQPVGPYGYSRPMPLEPEPDLHDLMFVRQARRKEFWRRRIVRVLLALSLVVLAALLAGQMVWRDRDRLALTSPQLRPWLARMCSVTRCRLGPPQQIEAIAIETSSFNKLRADTYRLNVTLRNSAGNDVAMPALELTLTDSQDQPVARRVVDPSEFAPSHAALASGDWSTSIAIAVNAAVAGGRIAGYRLLAFYP